jgi:hypothetical protein
MMPKIITKIKAIQPTNGYSVEDIKYIIKDPTKAARKPEITAIVHETHTRKSTHRLCNPAVV